MSGTYLLSLLQLADPMLPIGGYTHSNGLETYVQLGPVKDKSSAADFVQHMLASNILYNDAAFVSLAYDATAIGELDELLALDEECTALKGPREIREASEKLGLRLLKIFRRLTRYDLALAYEEAIQQGEARGHYGIAFGILAQLLNIPKTEALMAFYYNAAAGMVTNAVKLVPLGQMDGQEILFSLQEPLRQLVGQTLELDRSLVGVCNIGFDIRCMQHERLYSRLYMS
ncbi:MAG TPA: urease accessory protein UreF [Pontibacter sp.]